MHGLTVRWSLVDARPGVGQALADYSPTHRTTASPAWRLPETVHCYRGRGARLAESALGNPDLLGDEQPITHRQQHGKQRLVLAHGLAELPDRDRLGVSLGGVRHPVVPQGLSLIHISAPPSRTPI